MLLIWAFWRQQQTGELPCLTRCVLPNTVSYPIDACPVVGACMVHAWLRFSCVCVFVDGQMILWSCGAQGVHAASLSECQRYLRVPSAPSVFVTCHMGAWL